VLLLTLVVISVLFIISYLIFDKDLLAPPTAVALVFLFGGFCCFYNEQRWGLEFSPKSMGLIAAGIIATMLGGIIAVLLINFKKGFSFSFIHDKIEPQAIFVSPIKTWIVIAFQVVTLVLLFSHIRRVSGYSNWMSAVSRYRELTGRLADVDDSSIKMPFFMRNMTQLSRMIATVYAYIIGNNLVAQKRKLSLNWIPVILYTVTTFMQGDRSNMIRLWVVAVVTAYTIHRRSAGWKSSRETKQVIRTMALSIVAVGVIFAGFRGIVGRSTNNDPFYYVTFYAGSPTAVLNQMWEGPINKPEIFGQRILFYFNQSTTALFGWPGKYNFYYDFFKSPTGVIIGNAPTAFRPAYVEFGFAGFFFFFMACGVLYTVLYCKCRKKSSNNPIDFCLLVYAHISYVFLMYFYSTFFDFLSHVFIKYMIELLIIRWALVGWRFKKRVKISIGKDYLALQR
jgi:oligosaccharide repeat unit polymerase